MVAGEEVELSDMLTGERTAALPSQPSSAIFDDPGEQAVVAGWDYSVQLSGRRIRTTDRHPGSQLRSHAPARVHRRQAPRWRHHHHGGRSGHGGLPRRPDRTRYRSTAEGRPSPPPGVEADTELTTGHRLSITGSGGRRPSIFPLSAPLWAENL